MITKLLFWIGGSALGKWIAIAAIASIAAGSAWGGYKLRSLQADAEELVLMERWEEQLKEDDAFAREVEREALMSEAQTEVKIETVIKEITRYVTSDGCRNINDAGVQHIRQKATEVFGTAE